MRRKRKRKASALDHENRMASLWMVKGRLELFRKLIHFGRGRLPLGENYFFWQTKLEFHLKRTPANCYIFAANWNICLIYCPHETLSWGEGLSVTDTPGLTKTATKASSLDYKVKVCLDFSWKGPTGEWTGSIGGAGGGPLPCPGVCTEEY